MGYSASNGTNPSVFPSLFYTGRLAGDPLGTMPQGEGSIINGTGSQTGSNRWGDYTAISVDPTDDSTFWYVNEYVPTTSSHWVAIAHRQFQIPDGGYLGDRSRLSPASGCARLASISRLTGSFTPWVGVAPT